MSVLIKGMEMPKSCGRCWFNKSSLSCAITGSYIDRDDENRERLDDCPLVEVPEPHGRLIDKDRLKREMLWNFAGEKIPLYDCDNNPVDFHVKDVEATINSQPTVIEPEGKQ